LDLLLVKALLALCQLSEVLQEEEEEEEEEEVQLLFPALSHSLLLQVGFVEKHFPFFLLSPLQDFFANA
jgi:hypothetical protein